MITQNKLYDRRSPWRLPVIFRYKEKAMSSIRLITELECKRHYDIIVAGGGVAGVAAALTAVKRGKSVLLLEKSNILGGLATLGL